MPLPADEPPPPGTASERTLDRALRVVIGTAMAMPYARRVAFMGALTRGVVGPLAGYRGRALANLALIHPDWPLPRRRAVAAEVLDNWGRTLIENYSWRELGAQLAVEPVAGGGLPHLEEARAAGRPVIFVTGHLGNHEAPRHVLTRLGYSIGGLYREMDNPLVNAHYAATMAEVSGPVFPKGRRGTLGFVRHLAGGGMATILFDLHAYDGVPIPFLGRPAMTATTAADLALRYDALLLPYWGLRRADGLGFDVMLEEPIPHATPRAMMEEATRRLEARIAAHPGQWFWVHRRWKRVRGA
ncbi:lysophospholipid acyltransferase family protein [Rubellimicrobium aerolatum]|uniref:Lysophospholipid acyltransferase family protein n=1 Tax=Rubellimicrobium aerolatum TaxID=490979 RepID=A0ABW0SBK2_9RHOB|nr:lysophospholipid acyltransferase family protein [Rubellimicrobium aerolatum]MBP1805539.1 KDO2-lipid IV(A) lauroyltransferase [Rubellimicrobium aerolatum]